MIIAHLARACYPFQPYGGLESHVYHLTLELARLGHQVELYLPPPTTGQTVDDPAWRENVRSHYLPYTTFDLFRRNSIPDRLLNYPLYARRLGQAVRCAPQPPAVVHAHGLAGYGYARRPANAPLVLNPHGMEEFKALSSAKRLAYGPFRSWLRQTARQAQAVIATDAALVPEVKDFLGVAPSRVALIANAVALDEIDEAQPENLQELAARYWIAEPDVGRLVLLSVGRLETNKGFDVLLNALAQARSRLDAEHSGWRWVLVGTGSQANALKRQAEALGLSDRVHWAGTVDNPTLAGLYALTDIFLHPTRYEGSSLVTLESLARGVPVIASATGGLPDKIFEGGEFENGRLVPPGESSALAAALLDLAVMSPATRRQLGKQGRTLVEARFSWPAAARQTVALYERLLNAARLD